jgi:hypothetical protein
MEPEFITYQKFDDVALADELAAILNKHHIKYLMEEASQAFDPGFSFNPLAKEYSVKIIGDDFERVNQILKEEESENIDEVDKDYYLFSFTNDELMEVITKADEWSPFDVVLSRKLLAERGIKINEKELAEIDEKRIEELKSIKPISNFWIFISYIFALGGGVVGIFIGYYLVTGKQTLPDGERIYAFTDTDRKHGKRIFFISIVITTIAVLYKFGIIFPEG